MFCAHGPWHHDWRVGFCCLCGAIAILNFQWIFGGLGMCIGLYMAFGKTEWRVADDMPTGVRRSIYAPLVGFFSVLMGIGGGSLGVPTMTLHGMTIHRAVATSSGFGLLIAVPSVLGFSLFRLIPRCVPR